MDITILFPAIVFAMFAAGGVVVYSLTVAGERKRLRQRAIGGVMAGWAPGAGAAAADAGDERVLMGGIDSVVRNFRFHKYVTRELRKANLGIRVSEFFTLTMLSATIPATIAHFAFHRTALTGLLCVAGLLIPTFFVKHRQAARRKAFSGQLLDAVLLISNSIKSGYSFLQALDLVGKEMPNPISEEFQMVLRDTNYGIPFETAVGQLVTRMQNEDLDLILTSVIIQRQVGGNLAEILDKISFTIRERVRVKGEIRTLTAQGRLSGLILALLPVVMCLLLLIINPDYMQILFQRTAGRVLIIYGVISQIIGMLLINKIVTIEV